MNDPTDPARLLSGSDGRFPLPPAGPRRSRRPDRPDRPVQAAPAEAQSDALLDPDPLAPAAPPARPVAPLWNLASPAQLDDALDFAARVAKATVGEFLAAPSALDDPGCWLPAIDLAAEFLVPPAAADQFACELDRALVRRSLEYSAARRTEQVRPLRLVVVPAGTFHQWRKVWHLPSQAHHAHRWAPDRRLLDSLLHQAKVGWRDSLAS